MKCESCELEAKHMFEIRQYKIHPVVESKVSMEQVNITRMVLLCDLHLKDYKKEG